jgi:hypothetical protein
VADLRRLGRRDRYRPVSAWWWLTVVLAGTLIIAVTAELGWWFVPFLAGLAVGLIAPRWDWRLRHTVPAVLIMTLVGWGAPLYWPAVVQGQPVGATARVIAALAGLPAYAFNGILVTLLVAVLQAVVGLWLGLALTPRALGR